MPGPSSPTDDQKSGGVTPGETPPTQSVQPDELAEYLVDSDRELDLHYTVAAEEVEPGRFLALNKLACEHGSPGIQTARLSLGAHSITSTTPHALDKLCEGLSQLPLDVLTLRLPSEGLAGKAVRIDLGKLQPPEAEPAGTPPRIEILMPESQEPHTCKLEIIAPPGAKVIGLADNFFVHKPFVSRAGKDRKPVGEPEVLHRVSYLGKGSDVTVQLNLVADFSPPDGLLEGEIPPKISCRHIAPHFNAEYAKYQLAKDSRDSKGTKPAFPPDSLRTKEALSEAIDSTRAEDGYRNLHRMGAQRVTEMARLGTTFSGLFQSMQTDGKRFRQFTLATFDHVLAANLKTKDVHDGKHQEHVLVLGDPNTTASRLRMKVDSPADLEGLELHHFIGSNLEDFYSRSHTDRYVGVYPSSTPQSPVRAELDLDMEAINAKGISKLLQSGQYAHYAEPINEAMAGLDMDDDDRETLKQGFAAAMQRDVQGMEHYINHVLDSKAYSPVDRCNLLGKEIDQNGRCLTPVGWALDSASATTTSSFVRAIAGACVTSLPKPRQLMLLAGKGLHHEAEPILHSACDLRLARDKYAPGFLPALHRGIHAYVAAILDSAGLSMAEKIDLCNPVHNGHSPFQAAGLQGNLGAAAAILCAVVEQADLGATFEVLSAMIPDTEDFISDFVDALQQPSADARGLPSPELDHSNAQWAQRITAAMQRHSEQTSQAGASPGDSKAPTTLPETATDKES